MSEGVIEEFSRQSEAFNRSAAMRSEATLSRLIESLPAAADQRWLDAACGSGLVSRALAARVQNVHGVDLTPAMIALARREAARAGIANVSSSTGDVTALSFEDATFDAAVTRFSLHHIPVPERALEELARVVKPRGFIAVADHLTADDSVIAAWHQQLERLRDPSHWACLSTAGMRRCGERIGLRLVAEDRWPFAIDFDEWLERGSTGLRNKPMIERALAPADWTPCVFRVTDGANGLRQLNLQYGFFLWQSA